MGHQKSDSPSNRAVFFLYGMKEEVYVGESLGERVKDFERREIGKAIALFSDSTEGKKAAAKYLGISLSLLYGKLAESKK